MPSFVISRVPASGAAAQLSDADMDRKPQNKGLLGVASQRAGGASAAFLGNNLLPVTLPLGRGGGLAVRPALRGRV